MIQGSHIRTILTIGILYRFILFCIAFVSRLLFSPYDTSSIMLFDDNRSSIWRLFLECFISWDGLHFASIAIHGYRFEYQHAFFPLYPLLIRLVANSLLYPLQLLLGYEQVIIVSGITISTLSFFASSILLYYITESIMNDCDDYDNSIALISSLFFVISPIGLVGSALYTESLFTLLFLSGLMLFEKKMFKSSSTMWFLASMTRSNGILFAGFHIYRYLNAFHCVSIIEAIVHICYIALGYILQSVYAYHLYCDKWPSPSWCTNTIPDIYSHVQSTYW